MFGWKQSETKASDPTVETRTMSNGKSAPSETVAAKQVEWQTPTFRQVDRPDLAETFADTITGIFFDGQTLRIEFAVSRIDETKPGAPLTGHRTPACRLVLPPAAAIDLVQKMQQVGAALAKAGYARTAVPTPSN
jgi:hypothetical protein